MESRNAGRSDGDFRDETPHFSLGRHHGHEFCKKNNIKLVRMSRETVSSRSTGERAFSTHTMSPRKEDRTSW